MTFSFLIFSFSLDIFIGFSIFNFSYKVFTCCSNATILWFCSFIIFFNSFISFSCSIFISFISICSFLINSISDFNSYTNLFKSLVCSLSFFPILFNSNVISLILGEGKEIVIFTLSLFSVNFILLFLILSDNSLQISLKLSNWVKYLFSFIFSGEKLFENDFPFFWLAWILRQE